MTYVPVATRQACAPNSDRAHIQIATRLLAGVTADQIYRLEQSRDEPASQHEMQRILAAAPLSALHSRPEIAHRLFRLLSRAGQARVVAAWTSNFDATAAGSWLAWIYR